MNGYPTPGKAKARMILDAFCAGANGSVAESLTQLLPGPAAFYGVVAETKHLWTQAKAEGRDVIYIDNAMFDATREVYFRATKNRLQHSGLGYSDCKRFDALNLEIKPWRRVGTHVLICPQSDQFMRDVVGYPGSWLKDTVDALERLTDRPLRIRPWTGNKRTWYQSLPEDLKDCWALVTFSSASAITAMLSGIPAIVTADDCVSAPMAGKLGQVERPPMPESRREWAGLVADNQWSLGEMRAGLAWRMLNNG